MQHSDLTEAEEGPHAGIGPSAVLISLLLASPDAVKLCSRLAKIKGLASQPGSP